MKMQMTRYFMAMLSLAILAPLGLTSCRTARAAKDTAVDVADHAVDKTHRVLRHGEEKIERHL